MDKGEDKDGAWCGVGVGVRWDFFINYFILNNIKYILPLKMWKKRNFC